MDKKRKPLLLSLALLALIMILGFSLRLYRLADESVDLEEYVSASHLDAPGLFEYIHQVRNTDPPIAPLPFALIYFISKIVGTSVVHIRFVFAILGTLLIPLLFLFAYEFFGRNAQARTAGLIAALCAAMSPVHIFYSQEMRHSTLFTLFALASVYCLLRASRGAGGRWWILNTVANVLLVWTHMMGVILLFVEGLFLLAWFFPGGLRAFGKIALWAVINALLLIPYALWAKTVPVQTLGAAFSFLTRPGWLTFWTDFIADDIVNLGYPFKPDVHNALTPFYTAFDTATVVFFLLVLAYAVVRIVSPHVLSHAARTNSPRHAEWAFLLMLFAVPALVLLAASYVWIPCLCTRYSIYSSLALYVMIGGMVADFRRIPFQIPAAALVAILFGYQLTQALPGPIRTDWKSMAKYIEDNGTPDDVIIAYSPFYLPVFEFNMTIKTHPCVAALSHEGLCDLIDFCSHRPAPNRGIQNIWIYILKEHEPAKLESVMAARGFKFTSHLIRGERLPTLYCIRGSAIASPPLPGNAALSTFMKTLRRKDEQPATNQIRRIIRWDPDESGAAFARLALALADSDPAGAAAAFEYAITINPAWVSVFMSALNEPQAMPADGLHDKYIIGFGLLAEQKYRDAIEVFQSTDVPPEEDVLALIGLFRAYVGSGQDLKMTNCISSLRASGNKRLVDLAAALYEKKDLKEAKVLLSRMKAAGQYALPELAEELGLK